MLRLCLCFLPSCSPHLLTHLFLLLMCEAGKNGKCKKRQSHGRAIVEANSSENGALQA